MNVIFAPILFEVLCYIQKVLKRVNFHHLFLPKCRYYLFWSTLITETNNEILNNNKRKENFKINSLCQLKCRLESNGIDYNQSVFLI